MQELVLEVSQNVSDDDCDGLLTDVVTCDDEEVVEVDGAIISEQVKVTDASTNTDSVSFCNVGVQNGALMVNVDVHTNEYDKMMLKFKQQ